MERFIQILLIALEAVIANKTRSLLTTLGIIFGVAAVIAMLSIGKGAQKEILDQMKLVGVNNIIISAKTDNARSDDENSDSDSDSDSDSGNEDQGKNMGKLSRGLSMEEAIAIEQNVPTALNVCPEVSYNTTVIRAGNKSKATLKGVTPNYFDVFGHELIKGHFFDEQHMKSDKPVCVIGQKLSARLFQKEDPIGKSIKCGDIWFTVCGIIKDLNTSGKLSELGMDLSQNDVFAPLTSVLSRYNDRARITSESISRRGRRRSSSSTEESNRNQLDKITVQVTDSRYLSPTAEVLSRMILRRHSGAQDFEITIPELLLKQEQRTKDIFNIVLGAIASISLIVGGIGIMNIMLASVMERIREIGVRLAIGARKRDIVMQFLMESTLISLAGGIIGILLGVIFAKLIMKITGILTIISVVSIVISFGVSAGVGILFGYMPAKRASEQDPVTSLRHD